MSAYRRACCAYYMLARARSWNPKGRFVLEVQYRVHRDPRDQLWREEKQPYHPKDEDNARGALKTAIDALKDAGVIQTDARDKLSWGRFELLTRELEVRHSGKSRGVTITVRRTP